MTAEGMVMNHLAPGGELSPIEQEIRKLLYPKHMQAMIFIKTMEIYCHLIDDIIDEERKDSESIMRMLQLALTLFSSEFYHQYRADLYPLFCHVTNTYADSVLMERSDEVWKQKVSDVIRNTSNDVIIHIIGLLCGWEDKRRISIMLRKASWDTHHDSEGNPI